MAEKMDLKAFYESTKPTTPNINNLYNDVCNQKITNTKQGFVESSNKAFATLAHLRAYTLNYSELSRILSVIQPADYNKLLAVLSQLHIAKHIPSQLDMPVNPSVVPMIQRYIKIFETYEKQNGIENTFVRK